MEEVAKISGSPIRNGREIVQQVISTVSRVFIAIAGRMALYWEVSYGWMCIVRKEECVIMNVCRLLSYGCETLSIVKRSSASKSLM